MTWNMAQEIKFRSGCSDFCIEINQEVTGTDLTIKELAASIQRIVGHTSEIIWDSTKPDGTPRKLMDVSKMTNAGWKAKIGFEEGIRETYQWFLENEYKFKEVKIV
jgi:GDP-L-fucose synthase